jgi:predicted Zn-dependent protease
MIMQPVTLVIVLGFAVWSSGNSALASPTPQTKRSNSDADINAIGHRQIGNDTNLYSLGKERALGRQLSQEVERSSKLLNDPVVTEYIGRVAQKVASNSDARVPITVRVIDSDVVNALTLPGGYIYINRGLLLRLNGEAEMASLLARGIAHTALRSAAREATKGALMQLETIPIILSGPGILTPAGWSITIPMTELRMRQKDELDADYFGVQYLYKSGYDPTCFTELVQQIWGDSFSGANKGAKVFNPFPPLNERLADLQNEITNILPPRDGAIVSTAEFDAIKERLLALKSEGPVPKLRTKNAEPRNSSHNLEPQ